MKTIVNTAYADFSINSTRRSTLSNSCRLHLLIHSFFLQGEVICAPDCPKWQVALVQKNTGKVVFSLDGCKDKSFCFEPDTSFEYKLIFTADKTSTLRLYNTPDCITNIVYSDIY